MSSGHGRYGEPSQRHRFKRDGERVRGDDPFAANHPLDPQGAHQPLHCATGDIFALPPQDVPYLARAIELAVVLPGPIDLEAQGGIGLGTA